MSDEIKKPDVNAGEENQLIPDNRKSLTPEELASDQELDASELKSISGGDPTWTDDEVKAVVNYAPPIKTRASTPR
jgi:hypothetical protein